MWAGKQKKKKSKKSAHEKERKEEKQARSSEKKNSRLERSSRTNLFQFLPPQMPSLFSSLLSLSVCVSSHFWNNRFFASSLLRLWFFGFIFYLLSGLIAFFLLFEWVSVGLKLEFCCLAGKNCHNSLLLFFLCRSLQWCRSLSWRNRTNSWIRLLHVRCFQSSRHFARCWL